MFTNGRLTLNAKDKEIHERLRQRGYTLGEDRHYIIPKNLTDEEINLIARELLNAIYHCAKNKDVVENYVGVGSGIDLIERDFNEFLYEYQNKIKFTEKADIEIFKWYCAYHSPIKRFIPRTPRYAANYLPNGEVPELKIYEERIASWKKQIKEAKTFGDLYTILLSIEESIVSYDLKKDNKFVDSTGRFYDSNEHIVYLESLKGEVQQLGLDKFISETDDKTLHLLAQKINPTRYEEVQEALIEKIIEKEIEKRNKFVAIFKDYLKTFLTIKDLVPQGEAKSIDDVLNQMILPFATLPLTGNRPEDWELEAFDLSLMHFDDTAEGPGFHLILSSTVAKEKWVKKLEEILTDYFNDVHLSSPLTYEWFAEKGTVKPRIFEDANKNIHIMFCIDFNKLDQAIEKVEALHAQEIFKEGLFPQNRGKSTLSTYLEGSEIFDRKHLPREIFGFMAQKENKDKKNPASAEKQKSEEDANQAKSKKAKPKKTGRPTFDDD